MALRTAARESTLLERHGVIKHDHFKDTVNKTYCQLYSRASSELAIGIDVQ